MRRLALKLALLRVDTGRAGARGGPVSIGHRVFQDRDSPDDQSGFALVLRESLDHRDQVFPHKIVGQRVVEQCPSGKRA